MRKALVAGMTLALVGLPQLGLSIDFVSWLKKEIFEKLKVTGRRSLGYHNHSVEGDASAFQLLTNYGYGGKAFTDIGYLDIRGRDILGSLNFDAQLDTNKFANPQDRRFSVEYDGKPYRVTVGDVYTTLLNSNRLATFSKYAKGIVAGYSKGPLQVRGVFTEARTSARTITLQGNNSAGPYYLQFSQIVRGTEEVQVDGQPQRLGEDYVINFELGSITFIKKIITPTSAIVVTFEALGFNQSEGSILGGGATYDLGKAGRLGLTYLEQDSGAGGTLSTRLERFQGAGAPSTPYFLQFEPLLTEPITVKLDGILQTEGIDYYFDPENPVIFFFTRFIPLTSTIDVVYTPRPTQSLDGDRSVWGVDYRIPYGRSGQNGYLLVMQATGKLDSPVSPQSGTARGVESVYRQGPFQLRAGLRDIPADYVSVESRGFNRNERAVDLGIEYEGSYLDAALQHINSSIAIRKVDAGGNVSFSPARNTLIKASASYRRTAGEPWTLELARQKSRSTGPETTVDSASVTTSRTFGNVITHWGYDHQEAQGPTSTGPDPDIQSVTIDSLRLQSSYVANEAWTFGLRAGVNAIRSSEGDGTGRDVALTASYQPNSKLSVVGNYIDSASGAIAALGSFQSGFGLGYNGNGFSNGLVGSGFSPGATDLRRWELRTTYNLSDKANLSGIVYHNDASGAITSNSKTFGYDLGLEYAFDRAHRLWLHYADTKTDFQQNATQATSQTFMVSFNASPPGRLSYSLDFGALLTGGNSLFQQDGLMFDAGLAYRLAPRQRLRFQYSWNRTEGYFGQDSIFASAFYDYQLYRNIALSAAYRFRDVRNLDSNATGGAYRSKGLDLELTFTFAP